jgi:hypothetical protein
VKLLHRLVQAALFMQNLKLSVVVIKDGMLGIQEQTIRRGHIASLP